MNKLRFTGHAEPWEQKKLGEVATSFSSNIAFSSLVDKSEQFSTPVYTAKGVEGYVDKQGNPDAYVAVLKDGSGIGRVTYCEPGSLFISTLQGIKPNDGMDVRFTKELLVRMNLAQYKVGSGIPHVYFKEYSRAEVLIPSLAEQEQIGGFLSALDEQLDIQSELVDLLALEYTGYSQQIFSQKLRFKDENGNAYPEWENRKLGDISSSFSSNIAFSSLHDKSDKFKTPVYTAKGIEGYTDIPGNDEHYVAVLKDGAGIGRVTYCEPFSLFISTLQGIKPKQGIDVFFMKELLVRMNLAKYKVGSGIPHVYFKEYSLAEVGVPSLPEQVKIGGFLSSLSARLESERELLTQLREQKKAYLQKLLP